MVGHAPLEGVILVRIQVPQHERSEVLREVSDVITHVLDEKRFSYIFEDVIVRKNWQPVLLLL
jgi:hypothetical protein